eukprot:CAMPEP_0170642144 /NCGR_PEP_ID=MMETSP0224-20130122/41166_1 /TAXON_ID=285029 /ORGANISM="Togula jolla, Strain CCCM 725" /LENGTH=475 /DNA_ID=CAMNT_0010972827 /DNA_START=34 /DNA_END=1463 /DNA_ORIENTATION=+
MASPSPRVSTVSTARAEDVAFFPGVSTLDEETAELLPSPSGLEKARPDIWNRTRGHGVVMSALVSGWLVALALAIALFFPADLVAIHAEPGDGDDSFESVLEELFQVPDKEDIGALGTLHSLPEMYGNVKEKTIWTYWYHPVSCPSSDNCTLPSSVQLCTETIEKNRGGFDYKLIHRDEVLRYVNRMELPSVWGHLQPEMQKDALMNALLARYGGVAFDISVILLRPIDDYWDEMVEQGASFRGFLYRVNGGTWPVASSTVAWFMMARREGVLRTVATTQAMSEFAPSLVPLLHTAPSGTASSFLHNYSLPMCSNDPTIPVHSRCPELEAPPWTQGISGPARTDTKLLLEDPRDSAILPFSFAGTARDNMAIWNKSNGTVDLDWGLHNICNRSNPDVTWGCCSPKECWDVHFLSRFHERPRKGAAHRLSFVKLFNCGGHELGRRSREEILALQDSFFVTWLRLAGIDVRPGQIST